MNSHQCIPCAFLRLCFNYVWMWINQLLGYINIVLQCSIRVGTFSTYIVCQTCCVKIAISGLWDHNNLIFVAIIATVLCNIRHKIQSSTGVTVLNIGIYFPWFYICITLWFLRVRISRKENLMHVNACQILISFLFYRVNIFPTIL